MEDHVVTTTLPAAAEVELLLGGAGKASSCSRWEPKTSLEEQLVAEMVDANLERNQKRNHL